MAWTKRLAGSAGHAAGAGRSARARRGGGERGFTLAEILVAVTVMAVVFVVVFSLYDNLQKSFKMSENAAMQQQNTRVAFDRMLADVRMAGYNHNPDGDPNRPDEQIEGMWDRAITVRGDFDFEHPSDATSPENTLGGAGMPFRVVSIGNDEILTYALGLPAGTGGTSISFVADVTGVPRNGTQETVTVPNVHLTHNAPPYTLYRYIVSPNSTSVVRQPVADNVKELQFTYYDGAGNVLTAVGGAEDPNSIDRRKRISKVGIRVIGMTEDPDLAYVDPTDPNALTRHYRKFTLQSDVTPRNLGMIGVVDIDLDDPNSPANFTVCQGHCNGTYLKWQHPGDPDVSSYTVAWGTSLSNMVNVASTTSVNYYISGITGAHYYQARTIDMVGNSSPNVTLGPSTPTDTTTPAQTTGAAATGDAGGNRPAVNSAINVTWAPISGNTTNLSCDDTPYPIRDLKGYRVFKGATASFDPNTPSQVLQTWDPNSVPFTMNAISDTNVVNCRQYYYKVRGEDFCSKIGAVSAVADGASTTSLPPAAPVSLQATDMGLGIHQMSWARVTQDTDSPPKAIVIDKYRVYRASVPVATDPNLAIYSQVFSGTVSNPAAPFFQDNNVPNPPPGNTWWYKVTALDDCPNESARSIPDEADKCSFGASINMSISPGGSPLSGNQTITLTTGVSVTSTQLIIKDAGTGNVVYNQTDNVAPYSYVWNASSVPSGRSYTITGIMTNTSGCSDWATTTVQTISPIACCIAPDNPNISPTTGPVKNNDVFFDMINNCADDVVIGRVAISFTNNGGQNALIDEIEHDIFSRTDKTKVDISPNAPSPVNVDLIALGESFRMNASNNASDPLRMRYKFTKPMLNKVGSTTVGETIRSDFFFTLANSTGVGRCDLTVVTNPLSVVSCDPSSDPNCGV